MSRVAIIERNGVREVFFNHQWKAHTEEALAKYGYQIIELPEDVNVEMVRDYHFDLIDGAFVFNRSAYDLSVADYEAKQSYIADKKLLAKLSEDIIQVVAGVEFDDLMERRTLFLDTLDRVREYEGKPKRKRFEEEI